PRGPPKYLLAGAAFMHRYQVCVTVRDGKAAIKADGEAYASEAYSYLNGDVITDMDSLALGHGDRVVLGRQNNYNFIFVDPTKGSGQELIDRGKVTYEGCVEELAAKQGDIEGGYRRSAAEVEAERKRKEEYDQSIREAKEARERAEAEAKAREEEY
ncbi:hypothetical protein FOZ63_018948, partial [Perkinsus olseni]